MITISFTLDGQAGGQAGGGRVGGGQEGGRSSVGAG